MLWKLLNLFWRGRSDPLPAVDGAARTAGLVLGGRVVPELPGGFCLDRSDEEAERRQSDGVDEIAGGAADSDDHEKEADERQRWLTEAKHCSQYAPLTCRRTGPLATEGRVDAYPRDVSGYRLGVVARRRWTSTDRHGELGI